MRKAPEHDDEAAARRAEKWGKLPEHVKLQDTVEEVAASDAKDPDFGRNPDRDWFLKYAG
jgi:hypothetical protein